MKFIGVPLERMGIQTGDCLPRFDASAACKEYAKIADGEAAQSVLVPPEFSDKELEIVFFWDWVFSRFEFAKWYFSLLSLNIIIKLSIQKLLSIWISSKREGC